VNAHAVRFGHEIEEARARLPYRAQRGECPAVQAYLALYGGIALMRNGIEALECADSADEREVV
jgi:hypothetical protein